MEHCGNKIPHAFLLDTNDERRINGKKVIGTPNDAELVQMMLSMWADLLSNRRDVLANAHFAHLLIG